MKLSPQSIIHHGAKRQTVVEMTQSLVTDLKSSAEDDIQPKQLSQVRFLWSLKEIQGSQKWNRGTDQQQNGHKSCVITGSHANIHHTLQQCKPEWEANKTVQLGLGQKQFIRDRVHKGCHRLRCQGCILHTSFHGLQSTLTINNVFT